MKSLQELISVEFKSWDLISQWLDEAKNQARPIFPPDAKTASQSLVSLQQSLTSVLGAIVFHTGGLTIDHGWLRILGSGNQEFPRDIMGWNQGKSDSNEQDIPEFLLVADDVLGGFFALNGGKFEGDPGLVHYFSPASLSWTSLGLKYSEFIYWCLQGDLETFYEQYRWDDWQKEVEQLSIDQVFSFYPFLWAEQSDIIDNLSRKPISIEESFHFQMHTAGQIDQIGS